MSKLPVRHLLLGGLIGISIGAHAQESNSLEQRIDDLTAEWRNVSRLAREMDSLQAMADSAAAFIMGRDTVTVGFVRVTFDRDQSARVRPGIMEATSMAAHTMHQLLPLLEGTVFSVNLTTTRIRTGRLKFETATRIRISTDRVAGVAQRTERFSSRVTSSVGIELFDAINSHLTSLVPEPVSDWAGTVGPINAQYEMRGSYLNLISNPRSAARRCWQRDYDACRVSLGLAPSPDPVVDWYTAEDRRGIVAEMASPPGIEGRALRNSCVDHADYEACTTVLRIWNSLEAPIDQFHRRDVVITALNAGGDNAFIRLVASSGSLISRLETTAGLPLDTILARWRDEIDRAAGNPVRVTTQTGFRTLIWVLVFMLAAARSSRWRSH